MNRNDEGRLEKLWKLHHPLHSDIGDVRSEIQVIKETVERDVEPIGFHEHNVHTEQVTGSAAPHIGAPNQAAWEDTVTGRIYIAWLGFERRLYVTYRDPQTLTYATPVEVGTYPIAVDNSHGTPTICVSPTGHIHIVWGAHGTVHKYSRSNNPHDISAWTTANLDANVGTYPQIAPDPATGNLYIIDRAGINTDHDTTFPSHGFGAIRKSTNDGSTWSYAELVNSTGFAESVEDFYPLGGMQFGPDGFLHLFWTVARGTTHDDVRTNMYHAKMDPATDNWFAADGTALGTQISTAEHTDCLIVSRSPIGQFGSDVLASDRIIVIYSAGTIDLYASVWDGSSWTETDLGVDQPLSEESFPAVWSVNGEQWRAAVPVDNGTFSDIKLFGAPLDGTDWIEMGTLLKGTKGEGFSRALKVVGDGPAVALSIEEAASFANTSATAADLVRMFLILDPARHTHIHSAVADENAIHDNVAGEIAALTEVTPVSGDWVLIEDASDSNNKKKTNASNFLGSGTASTTALRGTRASTAQTISSGSSATVVYNNLVAEDDPDSDVSLNTSTGIITVANTIWVVVTAGVLWGSVSGVGRLQLALDHAGTIVAAMEAPASTASHPMIVSAVIKMASTDTVKANVFHNKGTDALIQADARSFISVAKL